MGFAAGICGPASNCNSPGASAIIGDLTRARTCDVSKQRTPNNIGPTMPSSWAARASVLAISSAGARKAMTPPRWSASSSKVLFLSVSHCSRIYPMGVYVASTSLPCVRRYRVPANAGGQSDQM